MAVKNIPCAWGLSGVKWFINNYKGFREEFELVVECMCYAVCGVVIADISRRNVPFYETLVLPVINKSNKDLT